MQHINIMLKPVSGLCNMRCKYCFYADETKKARHSELWPYVLRHTPFCAGKSFIGSNSVMHDCIPGRGTNIGGSAILSAGNQHL